jgi:DMSO reductase anchor subunit
MKPALSVLLLTTLLGAAQGLFFALYAASLGAQLEVLPRVPDTFFVAGGLASVVLLVAGLGASFFHLGRPERAWRAAAMWRTSWLSREVIALPLFTGLVFFYALSHHPIGAVLRPAIPWLGALAAAACLALFVCTGMIYACVRFLQEWASPLTVVNFILLGCASGFTLAAPIAAIWAPALASLYGASAVVLTAIAFLGRLASLERNARLRPRSTLATAIGIKHPRIEQKAAGFLGGSFNTREFQHGRTRKFVGSMRTGFLLFAFAVPVLLIVTGLEAGGIAWLVLAFLVQFGGLLAERWVFFAEANHPQNLYYQAIG